MGLSSPFLQNNYDIQDATAGTVTPSSALSFRCAGVTNSQFHPVVRSGVEASISRMRPSYIEPLCHLCMTIC